MNSDANSNVVKSPTNDLAKREEVSIILIRFETLQIYPGECQYLAQTGTLNMYLSEVDTSYRNFKIFRGHSGRDRMVVGFTTTYAISAYHY